MTQPLGNILPHTNSRITRQRTDTILGDHTNSAEYPGHANNYQLHYIGTHGECIHANRILRTDAPRKYIQMLHSVLMAANLLALSYYGHAQYNRKARNVHMLLGAVWIGGAMTSCWHFLLPKKVKITWEESFNLCMPVFTQPSLRLVYPLVFLLAALHCTAPQGLGIVGVFV